MGVLNITPDSFSDGGRFTKPVLALNHAERMIRDGAAIIDVGGESTRPYAKAVSEAEELDRVMPVIEALCSQFDIPVSVDTSTPGVIREAAAAGAALINDVRALRRPGALQAAAETDMAVCLMHMQGEPKTMQSAPAYDDVAGDVAGFLRDRIAAAAAAGIAPERLIVDPGFGFGKTLDHNLVLLRELALLETLGRPILVGLSRKSMLGTITGRGVEDRMAASIVAASVALLNGACIVRAHDVAPTVDAARMIAAVQAGLGESQ